MMERARSEAKPSEGGLPPIDRREFLERAAGALLAGLLGPGAAAALSCAADPVLLAALEGFFPDPVAVRAVGAAWLEAHPEEADPGTLVRGIAGPDRDELRSLAAREPGGLALWLRERHRRDFVEGRVSLLRGWILSRTELRLAALAAQE
jgi:hypothetical protein